MTVCYLESRLIIMDGSSRATPRLAGCRRTGHVGLASGAFATQRARVRGTETLPGNRGNVVGRRPTLGCAVRVTMGCIPTPAGLPIDSVVSECDEASNFPL